ncbi:response regulator [Sphingobium scionense]|uniref:CheY-like chemotaxis protein n=1 Tax=Sphingobium scionense TaxID=1404341 RepID=A0A7W6LPQ9_9SPHN|nr:CheY-like chemotaxis protein [Sphingobium scionense]
MAQGAGAEMGVNLAEAADGAQILIVEDEFLIRMLAADVAMDQGYGVLEAGSSEEAVAILERDPNIDLVFTDIDMPGACDGLALARLIKRSWPAIRVVVTSGKVIPPDSEIAEDIVFVPKPYRPQELANIFVEALL